MKNFIAKLRKEKNLTQQELAERAGTTIVQISRLETGARRLNSTWMEKISAALDVQPFELIPHEIKVEKTEINKDILRLILKEIDSYLDQNDLEISVDDKVKWISIVYERLQNLPAEQQKSQAEMMIDVLAQAANQ